MRVVSWNLKARDHGWSYLRELAPDIALLSEVRSIPPELLSDYSVLSKRASTKTRTPQRFQTALLARGDLDAMSLSSKWGWVNQELETLQGNFVAGVIGRMRVVSAYSPPWPIKTRSELLDLDGGGDVKLSQNPQLWGTELLWASLVGADRALPWIVGGDLNTCETFDSWGAKPRGNREFLDRMADLGFTEVLRHAMGGLTPTYLNFKTGEIRN